MFSNSNKGTVDLLLPASLSPTRVKTGEVRLQGLLIAYLILTILFVFGILMTSAKAETIIDKNAPLIQLVAQPNSCITLYQGRSCFANITFNWQSDEQGRYCLHQLSKSGENKILHCWQISKGDKKTIVFESSETTTFALKKQYSDKVLSETKVSVSWVHKSTPRKRRWQLF